MQERGINTALAKRECREALFTNNGKRYFAIAFPNVSGGYEIRNRYFKGFIAPKEITKRDKSIEHLYKKIEQLQEQHSQQLQNVKETHQQELKAKDKEISQLGNIIAKAFKWFPILREILRMEKFCKFIGFTQEMTDSLIIKKETLVCSGKIYSEEHKRKFEVKEETFKVEKDRADDTKLVLTINEKLISTWFKEQFEKLRQSMRPTMQAQEKSKGLKM